MARSPRELAILLSGSTAVIQFFRLETGPSLTPYLVHHGS